jgi:hypothetical protein
MCISALCRQSLRLTGNKMLLQSPRFSDEIGSIHDGDTFSDVPELPPVECLPLPGSILPVSLTAQFPKHVLLRASAACPPLLRIRCLQHHYEEPHRVHEVLMLCAVRTLLKMLEGCLPSHITG